jgi:hypothetical protein
MTEINYAQQVTLAEVRDAGMAVSVSLVQYLVQEGKLSASDDQDDWSYMTAFLVAQMVRYLHDDKEIR